MAQNLLDLQETLNNYLLGDTGGSIANKLLMPMLTKGLGLDQNPLFTTNLVNGGTTGGMQRELLQSEFNEEASRLTRRFKEQQRFNFFKNTAGNYMSEAEFNKRRAATGNYNGYTDYNTFINAKAQGLNSNLVTKTLYDKFDTEDYSSISSGMSQMYTNMVRPAMMQNNPSMRAQASYMVKNLFADKNGNMDFDKTKYGGFNMSAVSQIGAYVAKFKGVLDATNNDMTWQGLEKATEKFKDKIQGFSKALSPLKDTFQNDVKAMIQAVESMSGVSMNNMSVSEVARVSTKLSDATSTGMFNMQQLATVSPMVHNQLRQLGVDDYVMRTQGLNVSTRTATALSTMNATPMGMTDEAYKQFAGNFAVKTAVSEGANLTNNAYAAWVAKGGNGNGDTSIKAFRAEMDAAIKGGMSVEEAMKSVSGATSKAELNSYRLDANTAKAADAGLGADYAMQGQMENYRDRAVTGMLYDIDGALNRAGLTSEKEIEDAFSEYEKLIEADPTVMSMDEETFKKNYGNNANYDKLRAIRSYAAQDEDTRKYLAAKSAKSGQDKQRQAEENMQQMREFSEGLQGSGEMAGDFKELFTNLISGKYESMSKYLEANKDVQAKMGSLATPAVQAQIDNMVGLFANSGLSSEEAAKQGQELLSTIYGDKTKRTSVVLNKVLTSKDVQGLIGDENDPSSARRRFQSLANYKDQEGLNAAHKTMVKDLGMKEGEALKLLADRTDAEKKDASDLARLYSRTQDADAKKLIETALKADTPEARQKAMEQLGKEGLFISDSQVNKWSENVDDKGNIKGDEDLKKRIAEYEKKHGGEGSSKYSKMIKEDTGTAEERKAALNKLLQGMQAETNGDDTFNHEGAMGNGLMDKMGDLMSMIGKLIENITKLLGIKDSKSEDSNDKKQLKDAADNKKLNPTPKNGKAVRSFRPRGL